MGYDLKPINEDLEWFHFGAFSFPACVLETINYLYPCIHANGRYYFVHNIDKRFDNGDYPSILSNDGFEVTAEEAKIIARMCKNWVAIQESLPEENQQESVINRPEGVNREQLMDMLMQTMTGRTKENWPTKIRKDFVESVKNFIPWCEQSGGFQIW